MGCLEEEERGRLVMVVVRSVYFWRGWSRSCSWSGVKESGGKNGGLEAVGGGRRKSGKLSGRIRN